MPFPFILPTTSALSFTSNYSSISYPSLPLALSTRRGVLRNALKEYKRSSTGQQYSSASQLVTTTTEYLSLLLFLDSATRSGDAVCQTPVEPRWRATLAHVSKLKLKEPPQRKGRGLKYEIAWTMLVLAYAYTIQARSQLITFLQPPVGSDEAASSASNPVLTQAINNLLTASMIFKHIITLPDDVSTPVAASAPIDPPPPETNPALLTSLASAAYADATLLTVLKSDPYPSFLALTSSTSTAATNALDASLSRAYLYHPPPPPKGAKANLYSRLCIAAADHAAQAQGVLSSSGVEVTEGYTRWLEGLRRTARARGCRFLAVDAECSGKLGEALGWVALGRETLFSSSSSLSLSKASDEKEQKSRLDRFRVGRTSSSSSSSRNDKNDDDKPPPFTSPRADPLLPPPLDPTSPAAEASVLTTLNRKWTRENDTVVFERVVAASTLAPKIPSGREVHTLGKWTPPAIGEEQLAGLRAGEGGGGGNSGEWGVGGAGWESSDDEGTEVGSNVGGAGGAGFY